VRYRPNPYPDTIERFNAAAGTHFPTDLPADVVASVIGFQWMTLAEFQALLDQADASGDTDQGVAVWQVIAGLRHDELAVTEDLFRWATGRALGVESWARIAQLCLDYGWRALLEALAVHHLPPELRDQSLAILADGIGNVGFNDMGEPVTWSDDGDDDDDDDLDDDGEDT
jgi:hypothetical protein